MLQILLFVQSRTYCNCNVIYFDFPVFAGFPKAPVWLRKFCSHVLSQKLMRPRGVQYALRGMLEGTTGMYSVSCVECWRVPQVCTVCPAWNAGGYHRYVQCVLRGMLEGTTGMYSVSCVEGWRVPQICIVCPALNAGGYHRQTQYGSFSVNIDS